MGYETAVKVVKQVTETGLTIKEVCKKNWISFWPRVR
ncbi:hypothetical protein KFZ56_07565 [Virgibacillus sp. NKC19-3]|nr:hypothetical protein [Virgibacillus sp. NKC19-3]